MLEFKATLTPHAMAPVVKREVIGSAGPLAKWGRGFGDSVKGIFVGFLFVAASLFITYMFSNQVEHSKTIAELPLQTPEQVQFNEGMVKIQAEPTFDNVVVAPFTEAEALYFTYLEEEYAVREIEKTRTVVEDGQEIRETYVEYEKQWETVDSYSRWSSFSLGDISIGTDSIKTQFNTTEFYSATEDLEFVSEDIFGVPLKDEDLVDVVQQKRYTVTGVPADGQTLIVVGSLSGDRIASGLEGTFFVSNMTEAEFIQTQETQEKRSFWIMVALAWFLMTTGFTMFFGPITHILNILPGLGSLAGGLLWATFGLISAVVIFVAFIGFKFWWLILILLLVALGVWGSRKFKK